jgi:hypothetical protein
MEVDMSTYIVYNYHEVKKRLTQRDLICYYNNDIVLRYIARSSQ